jgi:hypothetical protein
MEVLSLVSGLIYTAEVVFTSAKRVGVFTVAHIGATPGGKVLCSMSGDAPTGRSADELEMDALSVCGRISAADTLTFTIHSSGPVVGPFKLNYQLI